MAGAAAGKGEPKTLTVLSRFAFAVAHTGEVVQLVKRDVVDASRFRKDSLDHLRSIGFIGEV